MLRAHGGRTRKRDEGCRVIDVADFRCQPPSVNHSEDFTARLHVDLRRQASAICATGC
ncbi:putative leader peptide [Streptomyces sioyaensis]|uniref:putative leader peptide n=1 Tax=Streptomyces sioyaensis TaxID=67364 RepID=UPI0037BB6A5D